MVPKKSTEKPAQESLTRKDPTAKKYMLRIYRCMPRTKCRYKCEGICRSLIFYLRCSHIRINTAFLSIFVIVGLFLYFKADIFFLPSSVLGIWNSEFLRGLNWARGLCIRRAEMPQIKKARSSICVRESKRTKAATADPRDESYGESGKKFTKTWRNPCLNVFLESNFKTMQSSPNLY